MVRLKQCLELTREINDLLDKVQEIEEVIKSPKGQVITGMPRGGGSGNRLEDYMVKREKYIEQVNRKKRERYKLWNDALDIMLANNVDMEYRFLMSLRFVEGMSWKACVRDMRKYFPNSEWDENKCFRVYRKIRGLK